MTRLGKNLPNCWTALRWVSSDLLIWNKLHSSTHLLVSTNAEYFKSKEKLLHALRVKMCANSVFSSMGASCFIYGSLKVLERFCVDLEIIGTVAALYDFRMLRFVAVFAQKKRKINGESDFQNFWSRLCSRIHARQCSFCKCGRIIMCSYKTPQHFKCLPLYLLSLKIRSKT